MCRLSIIIPVLNDERAVLLSLKTLQPYRKANIELILVDGGSADNILATCLPFVDMAIKSKAGRATQMNAGAKQATGEIFWFIHADSKITPCSVEPLLKNRATINWACLKVSLSGNSIWFRVIEKMMNWRTCFTQVVTGDMAMLVSKNLFEQVNGFDDIPLMEDIAISKKLRKITTLQCLKQTVTTSSRKWQKNGILKTILLMWQLRLAYFFGASPSKLFKIYYSK